MLSFKEWLHESIKPDVMRHVHSFVKKMDGPAGEDEFGAPLHVLHREPGSCSAVSHALCDHLKKHGIHASTATAHDPTNKKWNDARDDEGNSGSHTVVRHGDHVIDLTRGQFEHNAPRVHVQHVNDFRKEWKLHD